MLLLWQCGELAFVVLFQPTELGHTEVQLVEFPLNLKLFGNHIEVCFLCQPGITDGSGNFAAAELFVACFYHIKLLLLLLDLRVVSPFFTQQLYINAFMTPYFVHDGAELTAHILCNMLAQLPVGLGEFFFKKAKAVLCNIVFGFDAVDLCVGLNEFVEQLLGVA